MIVKMTECKFVKVVFYFYKFICVVFDTTTQYTVVKFGLNPYPLINRCYLGCVIVLYEDKTVRFCSCILS